MVKVSFIVQNLLKLLCSVLEHEDHRGLISKRFLFRSLRGISGSFDKASPVGPSQLRFPVLVHVVTSHRGNCFTEVYLYGQFSRSRNMFLYGSLMILSKKDKLFFRHFSPFTLSFRDPGVLTLCLRSEDSLFRLRGVRIVISTPFQSTN